MFFSLAPAENRSPMIPKPFVTALLPSGPSYATDASPRFRRSTGLPGQLLLHLLDEGRRVEDLSELRLQVARLIPLERAGVCEEPLHDLSRRLRPVLLVDGSEGAHRFQVRLRPEVRSPPVLFDVLRDLPDLSHGSSSYPSPASRVGTAPAP